MPQIPFSRLNATLMSGDSGISSWASCDLDKWLSAGTDEAQTTAGEQLEQISRTCPEQEVEDHSHTPILWINEHLNILYPVKGVQAEWPYSILESVSLYALIKEREDRMELNTGLLLHKNLPHNLNRGNHHYKFCYFFWLTLLMLLHKISSKILVRHSESNFFET